MTVKSDYDLRESVMYRLKKPLEKKLRSSIEDKSPYSLEVFDFFPHRNNGIVRWVGYTRRDNDYCGGQGRFVLGLIDREDLAALILHSSRIYFFGKSHSSEDIKMAWNIHESLSGFLQELCGDSDFGNGIYVLKKDFLNHPIFA